MILDPPDTDDAEFVVCSEAKVLDQRVVTDSGGHKENRYVIETQLHIADQSWPIEVTLSNRETMKFRMLLGRTAMRGKIVVDPEQSYLTKKTG